MPSENGEFSFAKVMREAEPDNETWFGLHDARQRVGDDGVEPEIDPDDFIPPDFFAG